MEVKQIIVAEGFYYYFFLILISNMLKLTFYVHLFVYTKLCFKQCYASFASRLNYKKVRDRW
jgi:hypothetical protein